MAFGSGLLAGNLVLSTWQSNGVVDHWAAGDAMGSSVWFRVMAQTGTGGIACGVGEARSAGATSWNPGYHGESWGTSVMAEFRLGDRNLAAGEEGLRVHRVHEWGYSTQNPRRLVLPANDLDAWSWLLLWGGSNVGARPGGMFSSVKADRCRVAYAQYTKCMVGVILCPPRHRPVIQVAAGGYSCQFVVAQAT